MSGASHPPVTPLSQALGRVPSGIFIMTARFESRATGLLASWVMQAGFDPPMVTAAVGSQRYIGDWIARSGRFTLNQVGTGHKSLLKHFGRGFGPDEPAFDGLGLVEEGPGGPVLESALAFLEAEVVGEIASGDHRIFLGKIVRGGLIDPDGQPMTHVRSNGMHY